MSSKLSYEDFVYVLNTQIWPQKESYIRKGQALMNFLRHAHPTEYKRLSSLDYYDRTDIDCFFNDDLIDNTLEHLADVWSNDNV